MKKQIILGSLLALASVAEAQWGGSTTQTGDIYRTGNVRVGGSATPINETMHIGDGVGSLHYGSNGMLMKFTTGDRALMELHDPTGTNKLAIQALSSGSYVHNLTAGAPLFLNTYGGRVSINNSSPSNQLHVTTSTANDGIRIQQTGTGSSALFLVNSNTGGNTWRVRTTGSADTEGAGHLVISNANTGLNQMFFEKTTGDVGVGSSNPNNARLFVTKDVTPNGSPISYWGVNSSVQSIATTSGAQPGIIGVQGTATGIYSAAAPAGQQGAATGVYGKAQNGWQNIGGDFLATGTSASQPNYGARAVVNTLAPGMTNSGIWASASGGGVNYAGYFNGNTMCTGAYQTSDRKLKNEIKPFVNALDKLSRLKPSTYLYKVEEFKQMNLPAEKQIGLIAQELEEVFPELVKNNPEYEQKNEKGEMVKFPGFKSINYISLIPVLISGVQEQQKLIAAQQEQIANQAKANDDLKIQVSNLEKQVNDLLTKTANTTGVNQLNNGSEGFALNQNIPNPFSQETVIKYTLTQQTKTAVLNVYDLSGKQITSFPLTERGASSITINSEKLAAGIYIYSVVADGKIMDSKRMVVAQK